MTPQEIAEIRPRLAAFAVQMLGGLPRKDQRATGELYARGLLTDGRRKSMQPMAARLGVDHQRLQQFITSSTWDYAAVRRNVARWFASAQPVEALVVDDTGFAKDGSASPCVARQYSGTLGKTGNCQVTVNCHYAERTLAWPIATRLYLPQEWASDPERRKKAKVPEDVAFRTKPESALDLLDHARQLGIRHAAVTADGDYGDNPNFLAGAYPVWAHAGMRRCSWPTTTCGTGGLTSTSAFN
jgi:SRSO17 transposase